ncbi:MAG TPA: hypothetical protein VJ768_06040 [Anaerolineales bacterium]|nr:hypothetical protein [Anaerolineales bacterium]
MSPDSLIPLALSFSLTLMVLSYLWKDNPLFRLGIYLFIGVAAGYSAAVVVNSVIVPKMVVPFYDVFGGSLADILVRTLPPVILGLLLFAKLSPRFAWLGSPSMGFLVGVGAAAALGGAVLGTLFPQIQATAEVVSFQAFIVLIGTILTLISFQFTIRSGDGGQPWLGKTMEILRWGGQLFVAITFGVLFAGVYSAALSAMIERLNFLVTFVTGLF